MPLCDNAISSVSVSSDTVFIISIDAHQGYHQGYVRNIDK